MKVKLTKEHVENLLCRLNTSGKIGKTKVVEWTIRDKDIPDSILLKVDNLEIVEVGDS